MFDKILYIVLIVISLIMMYLGVKKEMLPPALTGVGFLVILLLLYRVRKVK